MIATSQPVVEVVKKNTSMYAYELLAYFTAGLQLSGQEEGQLQWIGKSYQWQEAENIINYYETFN